MTDIPATVTVTATVQSKAEMPDGFKVELDIPSFNSRFPTICTRVPKDIADSLTVGKPHELQLTRQALKKNQDGTPKSGQYWSDYYWGLTAMVLNAPPQATSPATPTKAPAVMPQTTQRPPERDDTRASIEAQTAYNGAVRLLVVVGHEMTVESVTDTITWLTVAGMRAIQAAKADRGPGKLPGTNLDVTVGQAPSATSIVRDGIPASDPAGQAMENTRRSIRADAIAKLIALAAEKGMSEGQYRNVVKGGPAHQGRGLEQLTNEELKAEHKRLSLARDVRPVASQAQPALTPAEQEAETDWQNMHEGSHDN